jgi:hypothetical protein
VTMTKVRSIQGEHYEVQKVTGGVYCKGNRRHAKLEGHVLQEKDKWGVWRWIAHLECTECGTTRTTVYERKTWRQLKAHKYEKPTDYPTQSAEDCKLAWLRSMMDGVSDG